MRTPLDAAGLAAFVDSCPTDMRTLILELRRVVRRYAPQAAEAIRFGSLCYFVPGEPFGSIGGNICMIEAHHRGARLSFIHGVMLPDPGGLLRGSAKAKRYIDIRSKAYLRCGDLLDLIRASAARAAAKRPPRRRK